MSQKTAYEQGRPDSSVCRGCGEAKYRQNGAWICRKCDGPIHLLKVKEA